MNKQPSTITVLLAATLCLTACSKYGGIGRVGSVAWNATATEEQKAKYREDRMSFFRNQCKQMGASKDELYKCVSDQFIAEQQMQAASRGAAKAGLTESVRKRYDKQPTVYQPARNNKLGITSCNKVGATLHCYSH